MPILTTSHVEFWQRCWAWMPRLLLPVAACSVRCGGVQLCLLVPNALLVWMLVCGHATPAVAV